MKFVMLIILMLFTISSMSQEQEQTKQASQVFDVCSFLTDFGFTHRYHALNGICYIRNYIQNSQIKRCWQFLQESILQRELKDPKDLRGLLGYYIYTDIPEATPENVKSYWLSLEKTVSAQCGVTINFDDTKLSAEQKEQKILESVVCISTEISVRKKEHNCSD